tara:strand:+ start:314 stop:580 length:267 start_codon:yes stop_codon:yes gene_type:complete
MLNRLEFKSHKHLKKGCRQRADVIYTQARLLRESIGNEFQQYFDGWGKYDEARLQYAFRRLCAATATNQASCAGKLSGLRAHLLLDLL